ncbi:12558_t:CDS:1, partial [Funneliformis geosporum]
NQREKINKEEAVIDNLLSHYEAESHFKGLFPDWLVEKCKNNHFYSTQISELSSSSP